MRRMLLAAVMALAMSTTGQAAQIYKWVDAQGVTHFDAAPPAGQQTQAVDLQKAPLPGSVAPQPAPPAEDDRQSAVDARVKQEVNENEARRKANCEVVRTNLAQLKNNPRLSESTENGIRRLTEEERQARIVESQKMIADYCD